MSKSLKISPLGTCWLLAVCAMADDGRSEAARARLAFMRRSADEYHFRMGGDEKVGAKKRDDKVEITRLAEPVLRWDNQVVREDDAAMFLWVLAKRPVCAAQFFLQGDVWHHEFQSLTDQPFQVTWRDGTPWRWSPERPGLELRRADLEAPSAKAPLRLRQMRTFAERFSAATDPSRKAALKDWHQLRLLPTPVYRYSDERGPQDGALFAYVQGTNPEVLLLIEAIVDDAGGHWQYGFAPMTSFAAHVKQDEKIVWSQDVVPVPTRDLKAPYQFRYRLLPWSESKEQ